MSKPLKYNTPEALAAVIDKYLADTPREEYTVTGLALLVGSKQLLNDYQKRKGYSELVTTAKLVVENSYERSLRKNGRSGDIFALKNFGWKDTPLIVDNSQHTHLSFIKTFLSKTEEISEQGRITEGEDLRRVAESTA